ncbi:hypothetical protein RCL1_002947 [Eukaryota sp. TZLM3-RCL]
MGGCFSRSDVDSCHVHNLADTRLLPSCNCNLEPNSPLLPKDCTLSSLHPLHFSIVFSHNDETLKIDCDDPFGLTHRAVKAHLGNHFRHYLNYRSPEGVLIGSDWELAVMLSRFRLKHIPTPSPSTIFLHAEALSDTSKHSSPALSSGISRSKETSFAVRQAFYSVRSQLNSVPTAMILFYSSSHHPSSIVSTLRSLSPSTKFIGCTTSKTVVTERGVEADVSIEAPVMSCLGFRDSQGRFFTKTVKTTDDERVLRLRIEAACLEVKESMSLLSPNLDIIPTTIVYTAGAYESIIIQAVEHVYTKKVSLFGITAAIDGATTSEYSMVSDEDGGTHIIALLFMFSSCPATVKFATGYSPSALTGVITKTRGKREIACIDGEPAATVYSSWTVGTVQHLLTPESLRNNAGKDINILPYTGLYPLGILEKQSLNTDEETYQLMVPIYITPQLGLKVKVDVQEGSELTLMCGTRQQIIRRTNLLHRPIKKELSSILGGLVIYCAAVQCVLDDNLLQNDVYCRLKKIFHDSPFLMSFPYGEVGKLGSSESSNRHLNLSFGTLALGYSCPVFEESSWSNRPLAMLFSDIEGSTRLWCDYPTEMERVSALHDQIWSRALTNPKFKTYPVKTEGDSIFCLAASVKSLMNLALYVVYQFLTADYPSTILQDRLLSPVYDDNGKLLFRGIRLKIGLHMATNFSIRKHTIDPSRLDFFGTCVNFTSRICSTAKGGQFLLSQSAVHELKEYSFDLFGGARINFLGDFDLKGFSGLKSLYELKLNDFANRKFD